MVANGTPSELKKRYAHDMLILVPEDADQITMHLDEARLSYERKNNHIHVIIPDFLYGLEFLNQMKESLRSFELIQGTIFVVYVF